MGTLAASGRPWHVAAWLESPDPALVFRPDDLAVIDFNAAAEKLFAVLRDGGPDISLNELLDPAETERLREALQQEGGPPEVVPGLRATAALGEAETFDAKLVLFPGEPAACLCRLTDVRLPTTNAELRRMNWALAAYARSSTALIHFADIEELVTDVCKAIVGEDDYLLAVVGLVEDAPAKSVRIIASAGRASGYIDGLKLSWSESAPEGRGPTGISIRLRAPIILRDTLTAPGFELWRRRAQAHGIRSSVTVPFGTDGHPAGVLIVYAGRPDAFGDSELDVFDQLAQELAFAMKVQEARGQLKAAEEARRNAEQAARESQAELARAARLLSMGVFASSIAHEINQPIAAITTNGDAALRWLARRPPDLAEAQAALNRMIDNASRASAVVARTRDLLTKAEPVRERVNLNELAWETLAFTRDEQRRGGVTVETRFAVPLPAVLGDRTQLQQVVVNLILNAIEAMRGAEARVLTVSSRAEPATRRVVVEVADTGKGVANLDQDRVFENFFTTKPDGIGLGLSISRSIIEAHGGSLTMRSNQPVGAVFEFCLPVAEP